MDINWAVVASCASAIVALLTLIFSQRSRINDAHNEREAQMKSQVRRDFEIDSKLSSIDSGIKGMQNDFSAIHKDLDDLNDRVIIVEQSTKSAHHRIDSLEKKGDE